MKKHKHTNTNIRWIILLLLIVAWGVQSIPSIALAAPGIHRGIIYQGVLKNASGSAINGSLDIIFRIYDAPTGGNILWTGTYTAGSGNPVAVHNGSFQVTLGEGSGNALTLDFNDDSYYLGVTIGTDAEMTPRQRMSATGYAFNADTLDGLDSTALVQKALASGSILVGDTAGTAAPVTLSGDATINNAGVLTLHKLKGTTFDITSLTNGNILQFDGANWVNIAPTSLGYVSSLGSIDSQTKSASGAVISGNTLTLQTADAANPGLVSTGAQTLSGGKTFSDTLTANGGLMVDSYVSVSGSQANQYLQGYSDVLPPSLQLYRSRGTQSSPSAVASGNHLGRIWFGGHNGTGLASAGSIDFTAEENWSSSARGSSMAYNTTPNGSTAAQTRLFLGNNGNVGIGDTAPAELLSVGSGGLFRVNSSGLALSAAGSAANPAFSFVADSDIGMFRAGANILGFSTNGTEQARITASGNVELAGAAAKTLGLGDAASGAGNSLTIHSGGSGPGSNQTGGNLILTSGDATGNGGSLVEIRTVKTNQGNGGANRAPAAIATFDGTGLGIGVSAPVYRLELPNTAGSAGQGRANAWVTYSDETLKDTILTLDGSLEKVLKLRGVSFTWKNSGAESSGFIAQEVAAVIPEIVSSGEDGLQSLDYGRLTPYLVNAIQEIVSISDVFQDRLVQWFANTANGIDDFFAQRVVTEEICMKKSDSSRYCLTGDGLEAAVKGGTVYESPVVAEEPEESNEESAEQSVSEPSS